MSPGTRISSDSSAPTSRQRPATAVRVLTPGLCGLLCGPCALVVRRGRSSALAGTLLFVATAGCANDALLAAPTRNGAVVDDASVALDSGLAPSGPTAAVPIDGTDAYAPTATDGSPSADGRPDASPDGPLDCAAASPPSHGLALWLRAGQGYKDDGHGHVSSWADQTGGTQAQAPSDHQRPTLVPNGLNGKTTLHFEGAPTDADQQALERSVPINGLEELTIVFVNATPILWKDDPTEWCHYRDCSASPGKTAGVRVVSETGCSGTYQHVLWWNGAPDPAKPGSALDWSGVFLSPKQEGIGFRFGNTAKTYSDNCCNIVHDANVEWPRPASIGTNWTTTVAVHDHLMNSLFVDGAMVQRLPVPSGTDPKVYADNVLDIGNGFGWVDGHNHGGDVAEVLVYTRALGDAELRDVDAYLACSLFPARR